MKSLTLILLLAASGMGCKEETKVVAGHKVFVESTSEPDVYVAVPVKEKCPTGLPEHCWDMDYDFSDPDNRSSLFEGPTIRVCRHCQKKEKQKKMWMQAKP